MLCIDDELNGGDLKPAILLKEGWPTTSVSEPGIKVSDPEINHDENKEEGTWKERGGKLSTSSEYSIGLCDWQDKEDEGRNESTLRFCAYGWENDSAKEWEGELVREMRIIHSFLSYGAQNEEKPFEWKFPLGNVY